MKKNKQSIWLTCFLLLHWWNHRIESVFIGKKYNNLTAFSWSSSFQQWLKKSIIQFHIYFFTVIPVVNLFTLKSDDDDWQQQCFKLNIRSENKVVLSFLPLSLSLVGERQQITPSLEFSELCKWHNRTSLLFKLFCDTNNCKPAFLLAKPADTSWKQRAELLRKRHLFNIIFLTTTANL